MASSPPLPILVVAALLVVGIPVLANHAQTSSGKTVAFDHVTGNEWWVEVALSGTDAAAVSTVEAQDTNGPWVALAKKSWGPYAASFHIEPGNTIRFRATFPDGIQAGSCLFTHPAGVEQCSNTSTTTTTSSTTTTTVTDPCEAFGTCRDFDAAFTAVRGNEWWVQANVAGADLAKVEATIDGGTSYKHLPKQSWGGYAASFRIIQGSTVQLRATATDGATDLSPCYRWIPAQNTDATVVPCSSTSTTTAATTTTTTSTSTTTGPPPQPVWSSRTLADAPLFNFGLMAGDVDRDGRREVVVTGDEGMFLVKGTTISNIDARPWYQVMLADGDNDGVEDLYAFGITPNGQNEEVRRLTLTNGAITSDRPVYSSTDFSGPFVVTDLDGDGLREFYVGHVLGAEDATIERVDHNGTYSLPTARIHLGNGVGWTHNGPMAAGILGGKPTLVAMGVGDADDDGQIESDLYAVRHGPDGFSANLMGGFLGGPSGLVIGDIDGDGAAEAIAANETNLFLYRPTQTGWAAGSSAPLPQDISDIDFGDGDNDGDLELYATSFDGNLYVVEPASGGLAGRKIASIATTQDLIGPYRVAVGAGDADAGNEVYTMALVLGSDSDVRTRLFETSFGAPPVQPGFDATFTGVKGNEWWVQASVAGNQPLAGVDARVNCGAWKPLTKQSWGGWAASFNVPAGAKVDFRARSTSGAADLSGGYIWPNATPTAGC